MVELVSNGRSKKGRIVLVISLVEGTSWLLGLEFDNPAGNNFPHTVTSITWTGQAPDRTLASGQAFNSSPTRADYIMPGSSYILDTSTLMPGQYLYYCAIHPWMVGTFTVTPAS